MKNQLPSVIVAAIIAAPSVHAQTFSVLHSFTGTDGKLPFAALVQGTSGALYGTTYEGGTGGYGSIFQITPTGTLTSLHSFAKTDGANPEAGLVQASNGLFYGTTYQGGAHGDGAVFDVTAAGALTLLHSFDKVDGADPDAGLIQATNGALYGITYRGGNGGGNKDGTVFFITPGGALTTVSKFPGTNGANPEAGLIEATDGFLYGTTSQGGTNNQGTVFKVSLSGARTVLYSFCAVADCADGAYPEGSLVEGSDGNLYGTTSAGGLNLGTVFQITPTGLLTTIYSFCALAACADGSTPVAGLALGTDGNFYGTTNLGGTANLGTAFSISSTGTLRTLHSFGGSDGANPEGGLLQYTNGTFYGTASAGGTDSAGTVFSLSVGLGPFIETQSASGKVGAAVKILGSALAGATAVEFNGTPATFRVVGTAQITTSVPAGATSGTVTVTTARGTTLKSNRIFTVTP